MNLPIIKSAEQVTHVPIERTIDEFSQEYGSIFIGPSTPEVMANSYQNGYFPFIPTEYFYEIDETDFIFGQHIYCFPSLRGILIPEEILKYNQPSLKRIEKKLEIKVDEDFEEIIRGCLAMQRDSESFEWINNRYIESHLELFNQGLAHCVGTYKNGKLMGGLYGILIGGVFTAKSMFRNITKYGTSETSNASKMAIFGLAKVLSENNKDTIIDTMYLNEFLQGLGGYEILDEEFQLKLLKRKKMKVKL
jgi:leucyl/phenylalanyl-tRNA--protein transferase